MMFRHHKDPNYYDPRSNDKIFVPDIPEKVTYPHVTLIGFDRRTKANNRKLP